MRRMLRASRAVGTSAKEAETGVSQVRREGSFLERILDTDLKAAHLTGYKREVRFHTTRRWLFDFAWAKEKLAVEVEGGTTSHSRHTSAKGFEADAIKYNTACLLGWRVLRFTSRMVKQNECVPVIREALGRNHGVDTDGTKRRRHAKGTSKAKEESSYPQAERGSQSC